MVRFRWPGRHLFGHLQSERAEVTRGLVLPPEDLTARNGEQPGEYATHDGSGTPDPGLYRWDGTAWVFTEGSGTL